jgi:hypothetical protein
VVLLSGLLTCLSHSSWVCISLIFHTDPERLREPQLSWNWEGACEACGKRTKSLRGLFCGNFGAKRGHFQTCHQSWCSKCYVAMNTLVFHVNDATTDAGAVWKRKKDMDRYMYGRDGDMWSIPFQCERCWIVNLKGKEFDESNTKDVLLEAYI